MAVFIFEVDRTLRDAGKLMNELIKRGVTPKCMEEQELVDPSWRETTNFVHIKTYGSWHDYLEPSQKIMHRHRYLDENGNILVIEETKMESIIVNKCDDLLRKLPHLSFGNGVTVREILDRHFIASLVVDHEIEKRKIADEVIEEIRL